MLHIAYEGCLDLLHFLDIKSFHEANYSDLRFSKNSALNLHLQKNPNRFISTMKTDINLETTQTQFFSKFHAEMFLELKKSDSGITSFRFR